jgi:hypothetical protein
MNKLIKISAVFNHRIQDYELAIVKSTGDIVDHKQYYTVHWVTNPYNTSVSDLVWKKELNIIQQKHSTWDYVLILTEKKYKRNITIIEDTMLSVARNKYVNCFENTYIHISSIC